MHPQLGNVGILDLLEADARPTFVVDLTATDTLLGQTSIVYFNPALSASPLLLGLVQSAKKQHAVFWEWITSCSQPPSPAKARTSSACAPSSLSSFYCFDVHWSRSLVLEKWIVVGANEEPSSADRPRKVRLDSQKGTFGVAGSANKIASSNPSLRIPHHDRRPTASPLAEAAEGGVVQSPRRPTVEPDWVVPDIMPKQEPYLNVFHGIDWSSTPLGPMDSWPPLLQQTFNQILVDSRPIAMYWGEKYTTLYNEAFSKLCGSKHPGLLGRSVEDAWPEAGERLKETMRTSSLKNRASIEDEWRFFMEKSDSGLEEIYLKWSIVPIVDGDKALGFIHPVLETTSMRLWERRMKMLIDLGEALVTARDVKSYWAKTIEELAAVEPRYDVPLVILYSVQDNPDIVSNSSTSQESKLCRFEGALGVPQGHPIISPTITLRHGEDGLAPMFRDALGSQYPLLLQTRDGSLPESLIQGLEWRGFGDSCQSAVVCPIRPTREEDAMGLLLLGLNPRRPYDNDYRQYISLLSQKLTSSLASTVLLEEEARRGRNAVEEVAYDQKMLEEKLAAQTREANESVQKFEAVADFIPVGMAFGDSHGNLIFANDAWHRITGNPHQPTGPVAMTDFLSYVMEQDRPVFMGAYDKLNTQESVTFEFRLIRQNSLNSPPPPTRDSPSFERAGLDLVGIDDQASERHILASARAERAPDGSIRQILTCLTDVTIHKQTAEEAIRRAQQAENLKRMAELATVGMYEIDLEGRLVDGNQVFYQMCGLEKTDSPALLKPWETCVADEDLEILQEVLSRVVTEGTPQTVEVRFKAPWTVVDSEGTEIVAPRWAFGTFLPVKTTDGVIQSVCGCVSDVSLQKWQLERERMRKEDALESKRQQESFIDMTSHEMRNPLSAIIHCADAVIASLAKALDLNQGKRIRHAPKANGGASSVSRVPEVDLLVESGIENAETIIACAQHQERIVDDILTMSKLDSKLLAVTPITVNPLHIVEEALKMFEVEARRVDIDLQMVVDPSYDRLDIDFMDLDPSRIKQVLINLLTNALKFTKSGPTRNVSVTISASKERPTDATSSVQFIPRSQGEEFQQPLNAGRDDPVFLIFEVRDTGQGLTEEEMKTLFQRFKQASARTHVKYGGSGLGLFISRRLTEMHNGAIGVASRPGVGSTFAFYIEAHRPAEEALREARAAAVTTRAHLIRANSSNSGQEVSPQPSSSEVPMSGMTPVNGATPTLSPDRHFSESVPEPLKIEGILVVEDNLINQQITRRGLVDRGYTVDVANHGVEALEKLRLSDRWLGGGSGVETPTAASSVAGGLPFPLSLILMDVEMPVQDGLTCTRAIRELERDGKILGGHVPIIAVSANARLEQVLEAKAAGCDDVLVKPYRMPELIEKMCVVMMHVERLNRTAPA